MRADDCPFLLSAKSTAFACGSAVFAHLYRYTKPNIFLITTTQDRASCSHYTPMNDNSEGQDIDEGNEVEQDASGSAFVSNSSLPTLQRERVRRKRKIMRSDCWTS